MTALKPLLKVYIQNYLGINRALHARDPKEKRKMILMVVGMAFVGLMLFGAFFVYNIALGMAFQMAGLLDLLPPMMMTAACLFVLFTTIYKASGILFAFKDYDLVMSLPVRTATVVASRVLILYCMDILFVLMVMVPCGVVYAVIASPPAIFHVYYWISLPFIPLLPIVIATALSVLAAAAASRFRGKNTVNLILSIVLCVGAVVAPMFLASGDVDFAALSTSLMQQVTRLYPPAGLFADAVCYQQFFSFAGFLILSLAAFVLFAYLVGLVFKQINTALTSGRIRTNFKLTSLKTSSAFIALYKKELKRYFSSYIYVMNTGIGVILLTLMSVSLFFYDTTQLETALEIPGFADVLQTIAPLVLAAFMSMTCTTACAISLEGRNLWIVKSLPIDAGVLFKSKIAVNLTILLPAIAVNAVLFGIALKMPLITVLWMFLTPAVYALFISIGGLCVNLAFPNLTWTNEVAVIKQGAAMMIAIFGGLASAIAPIFLTLAIPNGNRSLTIGLITLAVAAVDVLLWRLLRTWGERVFRTL